MSSIDALKKAAAEKAVEQVTSDMVLGLGTGSTTYYALVRLGELLQTGALTNIVGIATSERTTLEAQQFNIPLTTLNDQPHIDLAIDGADEVMANLWLTKGMGGALLREKIVAMAARQFIVVVDESKIVDKLGTRNPLPVEVTQFAWQAHSRWLAGLGCQPKLRLQAEIPFITDNGNYILDCHFPHGIDDPEALALTLDRRPGIVGHGLFLGLVHEAIIARQTGLEVFESS